MSKVDINVSISSYDEIFNALEAKGIRLAPDDSLVISKDIKIVAPVNYKQVTIKRDVLQEVVKVYKAPIIDDFEVTDTKHFIDFFDDVYKYVLEGKKPEEIKPVKIPQKKITTVKPEATKPEPAKSGW